MSPAADARTARIRRTDGITAGRRPGRSPDALPAEATVVDSRVASDGAPRGPARGTSPRSCDPLGVSPCSRRRTPATCSLPPVRPARLPRRRLGRPARAAVGRSAPRSRGARRRGHRGRLGGLVTLFAGGALADRAAALGPGDRLRRHRDRVRADGPGRPLRHADTRHAALRAVGQLHRPGRQHRRLGLRAGVQGDGHDRPARVVQRRRAGRRRSAAPPRCAPGSATAASTWHSPPSWRLVL